MYEYKKTEEGIEITKYVGSEKYIEVLIIPEKIEGIDVIGIGKSAFGNNNFKIKELVPDNIDDLKIKKLVFPDNITYIEHFSFSYCDISEVKLPKKIKRIGDQAFVGNNIVNLELPEGLKVIGSEAFLMNEIEKIVIPDSVEYIGNGSFYQNSIKELVIGKGVKKITDCCFSRNSITKLNIPGNVKRIEPGSFSLNNFESIIVENGVENISEYAFYSNKSKVIQFVEIPSSVIFIDEYAFSNCSVNTLFVKEGVNDLMLGLATMSIRRLYLYRSIFREIFTDHHINVSCIITSELKTFANFIDLYGEDLKEKPKYQEIEYKKAFADAYDRYQIESIF